MPNSSNGVFQVRQESSQREGGAEIKCADQNALQCCARYSAPCLLPRQPTSVTIACGGMGVTSGKGLAVGSLLKDEIWKFPYGQGTSFHVLGPSFNCWLPFGSHSSSCSKDRSVWCRPPRSAMSPFYSCSIWLTKTTPSTAWHLLWTLVPFVP